MSGGSTFSRMERRTQQERLKKTRLRSGRDPDECGILEASGELSPHCPYPRTGKKG